ncbi:MAG: PH domain-containing protein, partial [Muribaculaceae bacterium]|nr:PH domain-containing protein [Muribaculaceae bacterium]
MKSKVSLGKTGTLTTVLVSVLLIGAVIWPFALDIAIVSWVMLATVAATLISQLFYAPVSIELTDDALIVHRLLARKVIPLADIRSASLHYPSGPIRTCGC